MGGNKLVVYGIAIPVLVLSVITRGFLPSDFEAWCISIAAVAQVLLLLWT